MRGGNHCQSRPQESGVMRRLEPMPTSATRPAPQISDKRTSTIPSVAMFQIRDRTKKTPAA